MFCTVGCACVLPVAPSHHTLALLQRAAVAALFCKHCKILLAMHNVDKQCWVIDIKNAMNYAEEASLHACKALAHRKKCARAKQ